MRRAFFVLAAAAFPAAAAGPLWSLQVDNDVAFGTDRWYTSGVRIARVADHGDARVEWGVLHEVYTPEARRFRAGSIDRAPTARFLAYGARHTAAGEVDQTLELAIGVRGKGAEGQRVTDAVHHYISAPEVDWSREVSTRVEARVGATRSHAWNAFTVHYGGIAGNATVFAHAGVQVDLGAVRMASQPLRHVASPPAAGAHGWGGFAGASVRAVVRDRLVDRGYDPFAAAPARERLVGRLAGGIAWSAAWGMASFSLVQDTREFETQRRPQRYGSLAIATSF